ncbi:MAG: glycoside hydrolase family 3 C-terminal domain-containing protein [Bifidobacteriaceae bacterium]|jgi:beta-glucosidase-like glycosyl hydrolase/uncharacterized protein YjdB|nr:glycoside hydrolase family 3 C-terminal domain-containing protein [Bifidobacteriaceae bacterium]
MFQLATSSRHRRLTSLIAAGVVAAFGAAGLQAAPFDPPAQAAGPPAYQDASLPFEVRAADLVSRMTLPEKAEQLRATNPNFGGQAPAIGRLGVRAYSYWNEALHGVARAGGTAPSTPAGYAHQVGEATEFPTGLGLAASWNRELVGEMAKATSDEARGYYEDPLNETPPDGWSDRWGLTYWSPTINLHRDPRWGRAEETYGEDPYLTGQIGGQFVAGMQGNLEDSQGYLKSVTTPKHFLANNSENDRHSGSANLTEPEMREYYTAAFNTLMSDYGAASTMTAYNSVNGVPQSANFYALETLARRTWGFDGFVTSDCGAIDDVTDPHTPNMNDGHAWAPAILGREATRPEGTAWSLKAGTDVDCTGGQYSANLIPAIQLGLLTENDVNVNLTRAFTVRMRLGEFDASTPWSSFTIDNQISTAAHRASAKKASGEAVVMLKNDGNLLPFASTVDDVVVLGEFAGSAPVHGDYSPTFVPPDLASQNVKAALEDRLGAAHVKHDAATVVPSRPGIGVITFWDATGNTDLGKVYPHDLVNTTNPQYSNYAPNIFDGTGWGFPGVFFSDRFDATGQDLQGWVEFNIPVPANAVKVSLEQFGGPPTPGGKFVISSVTGAGPGAVLAPVAEITQDPNGSSAGGWFPAPVQTGKIDLQDTTIAGTTPRLRIAYVNTSNVGSKVGAGAAGDAQLKASVAAADAVVVYVGTRESDSAEEQDRASIALPRYQAEVAADACALNPNTVVYIQAVGEVDIRPFKDACKAILWSTYNGQFQGDTVPDILWGDINPSGKLPFTYYEDPIRDLQATTDYTMTPTDGRLGRTYQYFTGPVQYPFGYGLSYSTFTFANMAVSKSAVTPNDTINVSVDVTNTSAVAGKEVVELYVISPNAASALRPDKQLKGFEKVEIAAGATKSVSIELDIADLWFWDEAGSRRTYDAGQWTVLVGPSSATDAGLTKPITLSGTLAPALDVVAAVPDGTVLNTRTPNNAIHANLSATRTDQSFYDMSKVKVAYTSSNPAVAKVDQTGAVKAVGAGVAQITAAVTADGKTKADTFPVVVYDGTFVSDDGAVLFDHSVAFADQTVSLDDALAGVAMGAELVPAAWGSNVVYSIAPMDVNTAGASVTKGGELTASKPGTVRVTAVASRDGKYYSSTATVTVTKAAAASPEVDAALDAAKEAVAAAKEAADAAKKAAEEAAKKGAAGDPAQAQAALSTLVATMAALEPAAYSAASWDAVSKAIDAAKAVLANPAATPEQISAAIQALASSVGGLVKAAPVTFDRVKAAQASVTLVKGKAIKLAAKAYQSDGSTAAIKWSSSKKAVAAVSATGRIVAKKAGTAKIKATSGGKSATITVRVVAKKPAKSAVTSVSASVPASVKVGATAYVTASYKPAKAVSAKVSYSSSAPAIVSVDSTGRLVGLAEGTAKITVKAGSKSKAYTVTVAKG